MRDREPTRSIRADALRSGGDGEGRATPVAYALIIVVTLFVGVGFFWMLLIPTILAFVILFFGLFRGGLVREPRP